MKQTSILYKIIATGSSGNAVIVNNILIDCGVSYKKLAPYIKNINLVLLTHEHSDHLNAATLKKIQFERPTLRIATCKHLLHLLPDFKNIDVLEVGKIYNYVNFKVSPVKLYHNVENVGYRLYIGDKKILYATDTNTLDGIVAKDYDLYMIEGNYSEKTIDFVIAEKLERGEFAHEMQSKKNHLSIEKAEKWFMENGNENSKLIYMHKSESMR